MDSYHLFQTAHPWISKAIDGSWWRVLILWIFTESLRIAVSLIALLLMFSWEAPAQEGRARSPFQAGELLQYKVKWGFIRLGTVVIRQDVLSSADPSMFLVRMTVRSAQGLPFININFVNQTILWKHQPSVRSELIFSGDDESIRTNYIYDSTFSRIVMVDSARGQLLRRDSIPIGSPCYDALGLLMTARTFSGSGETMTLPTLNDYKISQTDIIFTDEVESLRVSIAEVPIRCRRFEGNARWEGASFAGFKGRFQAWISDDEAGIPLRAEVGILLGSIVLELERYERATGFPSMELVHDTTEK